MRNWLKTIRCKKNYTQRYVAEKIGITQQYYNLIECGERQKQLSVSLATNFSEIFGVPIEWIIEQENKTA